MYYITVKQPPMYRQMTLDELLFGSNSQPALIRSNDTNTRTFELERVPYKYHGAFDIVGIIAKLTEFNIQTAKLHEVDRKSLYSFFHIPKKSGGLRKISKPEPELMDALRRLKDILEQDCGADFLYHTSAFAYVKGRCTIDAVKRHQSNESRWFAKYDLSNFFGSTTLDYVMKMFGMVFPFCEVVKNQVGREELEKALELAFLDGGLPQGTPISPIITNIMMIPVDHMLCNGFRDFKYHKHGAEELSRNYCVYTRYADDFIVSSKYDFDFKQAEKYIVEALASFGAPFSINSKKTRYGSNAGANWNLGVMLNKDNKITIGHKKKKQFQAMLCSFVLDHVNGKPWEIEDVQALEGYRNYYSSIEGEAIDGIINHMGEKFGVDIRDMIKKILSA